MSSDKYLIPKADAGRFPDRVSHVEKKEDLIRKGAYQDHTIHIGFGNSEGHQSFRWDEVEGMWKDKDQYTRRARRSKKRLRDTEENTENKIKAFEEALELDNETTKTKTAPQADRPLRTSPLRARAWGVDQEGNDDSNPTAGVPVQGRNYDYQPTDERKSKIGPTAFLTDYAQLLEWLEKEKSSPGIVS